MLCITACEFNNELIESGCRFWDDFRCWHNGTDIPWLAFGPVCYPMRSQITRYLEHALDRRLINGPDVDCICDLVRSRKRKSNSIVFIERNMVDRKLNNEYFYFFGKLS